MANVVTISAVFLFLGVSLIFRSIDGKLNPGDGKFDMVLMVEKSDGVAARKNFAKAIIQRLNVGPENDRLALYSYIGQDLKIFSELSDVSPNKATALKNINSIKKKTSSKKTNLFFELNSAAPDVPTSLMSKGVLRSKSKKALVFVASAGVGPAKLAAATQALKTLKSRGIVVYIFDYNGAMDKNFIKAVTSNGGKYAKFTDSDIGQVVAKNF